MKTKEEKIAGRKRVARRLLLGVCSYILFRAIGMDIFLAFLFAMGTLLVYVFFFKKKPQPKKTENLAELILCNICKGTSAVNTRVCSFCKGTGYRDRDDVL